MEKIGSKPFSFPSSVFFIGIGGIEVSALAKLALIEGARVAGTDLAESDITKELKKMGAQTLITKTPEKIQLTQYQPQLVVYSLAVAETHPLRLQAKKMGIKTLGTHETLGEISKTRYTIAVSGMHGKSTTTSMIGVMLESAGLDPLVIVGTKVPQWHGNIRIPKITGYSLPVTRYFVLEADEYRSKMLSLYPDVIVLTRVEEDHLDYYKNLAHIKREFRKYVMGIGEKGVVIANWKDENIQNVVSGFKDFLLKYNYRNNKIAEKIKKVLNVPGKHNVQNALAAYTLGKYFGLGERQILKGLSKFKGTWRRLELAGKCQMSNVKCQIPVISDYAHHPTEIQASLQAPREKYPKKRLVLAYQPHQRNRTKMLFNKFIESFDTADVLILNEIFDVAGREESKDQSVSSKQLTDAIQKRRAWRGKSVFYSRNLQETKQKIKALAQKNDALIIMGAGDIDSVARKLTQ